LTGERSHTIRQAITFEAAIDTLQHQLKDFPNLPLIFTIQRVAQDNPASAIKAKHQSKRVKVKHNEELDLVEPVVSQFHCQCL
jgi:hypothetical protein